jgi:voltage-gated potassium channel
MKLRYGPSRVRRFSHEVAEQTPFLSLILLLLMAWAAFAAGLYLAESRVTDSSITHYSDALYWCVAAFTTAGIADRPLTGLGRALGAAWMIIGSMLFFGTIVSTITAYFFRPMQRPVSKVIDTIEYNLERMDDLSVDELELLKRTTDVLIMHMEKLRKDSEKEQLKAAQSDSKKER